LTAEGDIGASALANRLNASRGTVYSDLKALSDVGLIAKNGSGWEVVA
jgi:predicted transcriptional regulator